jgi:hypothetical protein
MELAVFHPPGTQNFEVAYSFLDNFLTPALNTSATNMSDVADIVHHQNISVLLKIQAQFLITTFLSAIFHLSVSQTSV